jgi:hypothetical protein
MATERQIEANQRNAQLSTGPRTDEGKAQSRANAIKHGLAGELLIVEEMRSAFLERKAAWQNSIQPRSAEGEFALDRVVAATFRIEQCGQALNAAIVDQTARACLVWDGDRAVDAALLAEKLARKPEVVAPKLETTRHGVELMIEIWERLGESLEESQEGWNAEERSTALDLLGIARHLRVGRAPFDPIQIGADPYPTRRAFVDRAVNHFNELLETLSRLDTMEREHAELGASGLRSKPAALILRYEREAWKRYDAMLIAAKADARTEVEAVPVPLPVPEPKPVPVPVEEEAAVEVAEVVLKPLVAQPLAADVSAAPKDSKLNRRQRRASAAGRARS